jgi:hypothetical protein
MGGLRVSRIDDELLAYICCKQNSNALPRERRSEGGLSAHTLRRRSMLQKAIGARLGGPRPVKQDDTSDFPSNYL